MIVLSDLYGAVYFIDPLPLKLPMAKVSHFACDWANSFCIELGRSTRDRLLHGGTRCGALSTRILHFYRLTQCGDLGG